MVLGLPADVTTVLLFVLLVASFVIAFKLMQMVFETILVSVLSAALYGGMVVLFNFSFSLERLLLFAFLGATLYMAYSFLASAYGIASTLLEIPYHIIKPLVVYPYRWGKKAFVHLRKKYRMYRLDQADQQYSGQETDGDNEEGGDVKEVVLDKVRKKDDD